MIRKVGRFYWLDFRIDGKRIRRSLRTSNHIQALDEARRVKEELIVQYSKTDVLFKDFCKKYLEWAWSEKPASARREEQRLQKCRDYFGTHSNIVKLSDITPYHIERLKIELKKTGLETDPKKQRGLSNATVNRYLQILRGMFYKAIKWKMFSGDNPVCEVKFYKESSQIKALTPEQIKKVLAATRTISDNPRSQLQKVFYGLVVFALNTGMRKSEILDLKWEDIKNGEARVRGKGGKIRSVPLNHVALTVVNQNPQVDTYVFDVPNRHQHDLLRRTINQVKKQSGVYFRFHMLRHTFATMLIELGVDLVTIASLLGHSKTTVSLLYTHTDSSRKRRAVEFLEQK